MYRCTEKILVFHYAGMEYTYYYFTRHIVLSTETLFCVNFIGALKNEKVCSNAKFCGTQYTKE